MVPAALRPLYIEELRRLTADLNRTAQRIESVLASLRASAAMIELAKSIADEERRLAA